MIRIGAGPSERATGKEADVRILDPGTPSHCTSDAAAMSPSGDESMPWIVRV